MRFSRESIVPVAAEYDRTMAYPWPLLKEAHSLGLLNTHIPEAVRTEPFSDECKALFVTEYGGSELGLMECAIVSESLAFGCSGIQTAMEGAFNYRALSGLS